jgi:hypothetical protein
MNLEFLKTDSPVFWEGVKLGLMMSAFTQSQKNDPMLSERQAALKFGMSSEQFRKTFVFIKDPEIAPVTTHIPGRTKYTRKYLLSDVNLLIEKHKNKFDYQGWEKKKVTHRYF